MYRHHKQVSHRLYRCQQSAYHLSKNLTPTTVTTPQSFSHTFSWGFLRNLRGFTKCQSNQNADVLEAESCNSLIFSRNENFQIHGTALRTYITENNYL